MTDPKSSNVESVVPDTESNTADTGGNGANLPLKTPQVDHTGGTGGNGANLPVKTPKLDHTHPLHLHSSDNPGLSLISEKLTNSDDYPFWSKAMRICLTAKNKLGFITGACKKEDFDESLHDVWDQCNALVLAWIMNSVSRELMSGNIYTESAFLVWEDLKERLRKVNGSRIFQLHRDICLAQQGTDSIAAYFARIRSMWEEFDAICNLPNCGCELFKAHITHANNMRLFQFLNGLNETYANVRTNLVMREVLPSVSQAYSVLIQEENQRKLSGGNTVVLNAISEPRAGSSSNQQRGTKRNWNLVCDHCKGKGHDFDHCFKRKGYPPGWKFKNNRTPQANNAVDGNLDSGSEKAANVAATPTDLPKNQPLIITSEQLEHLAREMTKRHKSSDSEGKANMVGDIADDEHQDPTTHIGDLEDYIGHDEDPVLQRDGGGPSTATPALLDRIYPFQFKS